ncbi:dethiobiotin synthase [Pontiellaceae bacterium B12219]|nr:dethiobiotin synthase [Pontiellaceae bacterium B12219]
MNGLFITGTDTDIGKTALSALLLAELRRRGTNAAPMKPAQTGCALKPEDTNDPEFQVSGFKPPVSSRSVPDLDYSLSMASMTVSGEDYANMAPYTFEPACSPHLAAKMAGIEIELAEIVIAARTLASEYEFVIAEGAGGIMVPLNSRETMLDLMQALKLPVLLAARPGLGTINHTLLSIRALRSDGLNIAGVVLIASQPGEPGFIEEDNANAITQFGNVPILGTIPYCAQLAETNPKFDNLPIPVVAEIEKIVNQLAL